MDEEQEQQVPELQEVDLYGVKFSVPKDIAGQIIAKRDERVSGYNELSEQMNTIKSKEQETLLKASEAERRAQALEAAKNNDIDKAKQLLSAEYQDKISKYEAHSYRMAISNAIKSRTDLVDGVADDATNQIAAMAKWSLADDFTVVDSEGRSVAEIVNDFIDSRPYMKLAQGNTPLGQPKSAKKVAPSRDTKADFAKGMAKLVSQPDN